MQWFCRTGRRLVQTPRTRRDPGLRPIDSCSTPRNTNRRRKYARIAAVRWRITISSGMPSAPKVAFSKASGSATGSAARCSCKSTSAAARYSTVAKPWLKVLADLILAARAGGRGSPRLVVQREPRHQFWDAKPVLVELRGKLHEIADHARTRQRRVVDLRVQAMQRVAELVKQRHRIIPADENRGVPVILQKVGVVGYDGYHRHVQIGLFPVFAHPCSGIFAGARIRIEKPKPDGPARFGLDLPHPHVGIVDGDAGHLGERKAVQAACRPEHCFAQFLELQVRLHLVHVEVEFRAADLFRVVAVVPRLDPHAGRCDVGDGLHVGDFFARPRDRGRPDAHQQSHGRIGMAGHAVLQPPMRMRGIAEQLGALPAQCEYFRNDSLVVVSAAVVAAVVVRAPDRLAQISALGVG